MPMPSTPADSRNVATVPESAPLLGTAGALALAACALGLLYALTS